MATSRSMFLVDDRFATFTESLSSKGKSTKSKQTKFKWPHPPTWTTNPRTLSDAGFYYDPESGSEDRVTCFTCGWAGANWEEEDDPFVEHAKRGKDCSWAAATCDLKKDVTSSADGEFTYTFYSADRLPTAPTFQKARLRTFQLPAHPWPHDNKKGHRCTSAKMSKAGWVYAPEGDQNDQAFCPYCLLFLSGWEAQDDPTEEHKRRRPNCALFTAVVEEQPREESEASVLPSTTTKKTTTKAKTQSKKKSTMTTAAPSQSESEAPVPSQSRSNRSSRASKQPSSNAEPAPSTRNTRTKKAETATETELESVAEDDPETTPVVTKKAPKSKATRSAAASEAEVEPAPVPAAKPKGSRQKAKTAPAPAASASEVEPEEEDRPSTGKRKATTSQPQSEPLGPYVSPALDDAPAKPTATAKRKGRKTTTVSKATAPTDSEADVEPAPPTSPTHAAPKSKAKPKSKRIVSPPEDVEVDVNFEPAPPPKPRGSTRTRLRSKSQTMTSEAEVDTVEEMVKEPPRSVRSKGKAKTLVEVVVQPRASLDAQPPTTTKPAATAKKASTRTKGKGKQKATVAPSEEESLPATEEDEDELAIAPTPRARKDEGTMKKKPGTTARKKFADIGRSEDSEAEGAKGPIERMVLDGSEQEEEVFTYPMPESAPEMVEESTPVARQPGGLSDEIMVDADNPFAPKAPPPPLIPSPLPALSEEERKMTIEQWIRHQMKQEYLRIQAEGLQRIEMFKALAEETRQTIESL